MGKDTVVIKNDLIYSSYIARACKIVPNRRLVSIALNTPDYFGGSFLRELNPTPMMIHNIKNGNITAEEYEEAYRKEVLSQLNVHEVTEKLKGKIICCYEKPSDFCHRHIVMKWIAENIGEQVIGGEI